jgi:colicin import membrane protein
MSVPPVLDPTTAGPGPAPVITPTDPTEADPYFYGWRYVRRLLPNGGSKMDRVPLTEWDVLHPQEEDHIMQDDPHDMMCHYLKWALLEAFLGRLDVKVIHDQRVDWQQPGTLAHGPDVAVFDGLRSTSTGGRGTFYVKDLHARPLLVVEVVSPNTRNVDLNEKVREYHRAGVPFYLIVDRSGRDDRPTVELVGYRNAPDGYVVLPPDEAAGVWIPTVQLWFRIEAGTVACYTRDGRRLRDHVGVIEQRNEAELRAAEEKQRADDLQRQLLELQEQLKRQPPGA